MTCRYAQRQCRPSTPERPAPASTAAAPIAAFTSHRPRRSLMGGIATRLGSCGRTLRLNLLRAFGARWRSGKPTDRELARLAMINNRQLWHALGAVRSMVEEFAPCGSVTGEEYLRDPDPMTEAEAICIGIAAIIDHERANAQLRP